MANQKDKLGVYRLTYDKANKEWVITRDKSERASRRCKTKEEAMVVLKELSKNQDTGTVIHKKDGKWQKKNYKK